MPLNTLPSSPSLLRLKRLSKQLLSAARRNDAQALQRLTLMFAGVTAATATLSQAQSVLAREHGYPSWHALGAAVATRNQKSAARALRAAARSADAATLARTWLDLVEANDLEGLVGSMTVGKARGQAARNVLQQSLERNGRLVAMLIGGTAHANARLRYECAHLLDTFGDASAVPALRALMTDPVPRVRAIAIHALSCHACSEATCVSDPDYLAAVEYALDHDPSSRVRREAAIALGEAGGNAAVLERVKAEASDAALRRAAAFGLRALNAHAG